MRYTNIMMDSLIVKQSGSFSDNTKRELVVLKERNSACIKVYITDGYEFFEFVYCNSFKDVVKAIRRLKPLI